MLYISRLPRATFLEMVVPAHALGKVMGKGGANLENIRKVGYLLWVNLYFVSTIVSLLVSTSFRLQFYMSVEFQK